MRDCTNIAKGSSNTIAARNHHEQLAERMGTKKVQETFRKEPYYLTYAKKMKQLEAGYMNECEGCKYDKSTDIEVHMAKCNHCKRGYFVDEERNLHEDMYEKEE